MAVRMQSRSIYRSIHVVQCLSNAKRHDYPGCPKTCIHVLYEVICPDLCLVRTPAITQTNLHLFSLTGTTKSKYILINIVFMSIQYV